MAAQIATLRDISLEDVLEAKRKNIEEVLRHCHVLEHDFKYMDAVNNALCRTLVISVGEKGTVKCHWTRNSNFLAIL